MKNKNFPNLGSLGKYRKYRRFVVFDGEMFAEIWIDPHYSEKHGEHMSDALILEVLQVIDTFDIENVSLSKGFQYYVARGSFYGRPYKLVLVLPPDRIYLGVRNAHRE